MLASEVLETNEKRGSIILQTIDNGVIAAKSFLVLHDEVENSLTASFLTQLKQVVHRSWVTFWRKPAIFYSHMVFSAILGLFIGVVYLRVGSNLGGIQNRLGSIFFTQCIMGFSGMSAITTFSGERLLFMRERSNGFYGPLPFLISKVKNLRGSNE